MDFKVGDVVQLKSGGPLMTVDEIEESGRVFCTWFESDHKKTNRQSFPASMLKKLEE